MDVLAAKIHKAIGLLWVLLSCNACLQEHHIREYSPQPPLWNQQKPWTSETLAQQEAGSFLARQFQKNSEISDDYTTLCRHQIQWDSAFVFESFHAMDWKYLPATLDIRFKNGQRIRMIWTALPHRWLVEPLLDQNLSLHCLHCPTEAEIQRKEQRCRSHQPVPSFSTAKPLPQDERPWNSLKRLLKQKNHRQDIELPAEFHILCEKNIHWDSSYTFSHYEPASNKLWPSTLEITLKNGQHLRAFWGVQSGGWLLEPLGIGDDLPRWCAYCPTPSSIQQKQRQCQEKPD